MSMIRSIPESEWNARCSAMLLHMLRGLYSADPAYGEYMSQVMMYAPMQRQDSYSDVRWTFNAQGIYLLTQDLHIDQYELEDILKDYADRLKEEFHMMPITWERHPLVSVLLLPYPLQPSFELILRFDMRFWSRYWNLHYAEDAILREYRGVSYE